jgi:hypothetical protein
MYPDINTFGRSVALDGNTLVVGADDPSCATGINGDQADASCFRAGAVYVFTRTGETWSQQAYLKPSNTNTTFYFGESVSLSGDTLAVGAWAESGCARGVNGDDQNQSAGDACGGSGAVYVFTRSGSTWSQQAYLKASLLDPNGNHENFGRTVAISGNTIAVGAPQQGFNEGCPVCRYLGAVYVFTRSNGQWTQEALLRSSNPVNQFEAFGFTVTLDGDTIAASNITESSCATGVNGDQFSNRTCYDTGAVYVFTRNAGVWTQQAYVKASNTGSRLFGFGLAVNGEALIVGAPKEQSCATGINGNQSDTGCPESGAVYIFNKINKVWSQVAYVKPLYPNLQSFGGNFGTSVAFDGTTIAVNADDNNCAKGVNPSPMSNDCTSSGAVYLFTRTATSWGQRGYVKASNPDGWDYFGGGRSCSRLDRFLAGSGQRRTDDHDRTGVADRSGVVGQHRRRICHRTTVSQVVRSGESHRVGLPRSQVDSFKIRLRCRIVRSEVSARDDGAKPLTDDFYVPCNLLHRPARSEIG